MIRTTFPKFEIWKYIKGWPEYQVSNQGRIRSVKRIINSKSGKRILLSKIRKISTNTKGYSVISLYHNNIGKQYRVNLLVIHHFGSVKPTPNHECNHKDGDKSNNWNVNLEWNTHKQNMEHAVKTGLKNHKGESHPNAVLKDKQVVDIRKKYGAGQLSYTQLADLFKVSKKTILLIIQRKTWTHI